MMGTSRNHSATSATITATTVRPIEREDDSLVHLPLGFDRLPSSDEVLRPGGWRNPPGRRVGRTPGGRPASVFAIRGFAMNCGSELPGSPRERTPREAGGIAAGLRGRGSRPSDPWPTCCRGNGRRPLAGRPKCPPAGCPECGAPGVEARRRHGSWRGTGGGPGAGAPRACAPTRPGRGSPVHDEAAIAVTRTGTGPEVLLVHGGASAATTWSGLEPLSERWTLAYAHRRGYPPSPPPLDGRQDFEVDAADLAPLLDERPHLVAHSYGAVGAVLAAARRPGQRTVADPARAGDIRARGRSRGRSFSEHRQRRPGPRAGDRSGDPARVPHDRRRADKRRRAAARGGQARCPPRAGQQTSR